MANCKGCYKEVTWDEEIRNSLGIRKPAELVNGKYVEHICPKYQQKQLSSSSSNTYTSKYSNPNNYTGSSKDYQNKQVAQQQQAETTTTIPTSIITTILETQKQILNEMEFLRSRFDDMYQTVNNTYLKQETMKTDLSLLGQNVKALLVNKDDDPFVDTDPDYDQSYKKSIAVKEE